MEASESAPSPLPRQLPVLLPAFLSDSLAMAIVFPILPFLVQSLMLFPPDEQHKIGYYTGLLGGAYSFGQILSTPLWGALSDSCGRRPVILVCLFGSSIFMAAFGFSTSFWMAFALRVSQGMANGVSAVGRTYLADVTDHSNETRSFALIGIVFGAGDIIGPPLGGLLSEPARQYPVWFASQSEWVRELLITFPYLAPCLAVSMLGFLEFLLALVALPESRTHSQDNDADDASIRAKLTTLRDRPLLQLACWFSAVFGAGIAAFDQLMPVWARDQLNFVPAQLGRVQAVSGVFSIIGSFFMITRLEAAFGIGKATCIALAIVGIGYALPIIDIVSGRQNDTTASWAFLSIAFFFKGIGIESCFTGVTLLLTHSVPEEFNGLAQGVGGSAMNIGLTLGPLWGPPLYGVALASGGALGAVLPFIALTLVNILTILLVYRFETRLRSCNQRGVGVAFEDSEKDLLSHG